MYGHVANPLCLLSQGRNSVHQGALEGAIAGAHAGGRKFRLCLSLLQKPMNVIVSTTALEARRRPPPRKHHSISIYYIAAPRA
jgi:hypothetical protein